MLSILSAALALGAPPTAMPEIPTSVESALIVNYRVVRPGLATAGKVSPAGLAQLTAFGFKTIVNLRTEQEGAKEEGETVKGLGLRYVWVPVVPETLTLEDVKTIGKVLDDSDARPILFHCASANRVGGVWAVWQVLKGTTAEEALAQGQAIGLKAGAVTEAARRLIGEALKGKEN
jgi:uncharacterized protein (TIGR01244 family)